MANGSEMKVESITECSPWSILQYFWPALSNDRSWKPIFGLFEWPLTQVLLYVKHFICRSDLTFCQYWWDQIVSKCFQQTIKWPLSGESVKLKPWSYTYWAYTFVLFVWFDALRPINNLSVIKGRVFLGWTSTKLGLMFLLKDTTQWRRLLGLKSGTLPLSHCAPAYTFVGS